MVELKEVLDELVENTKSGDLKWTVDRFSRRWSVKCGANDFTVSAGAGDGRLILNVALPVYPDTPSHKRVLHHWSIWRNRATDRPAGRKVSVRAAAEPND